jgi:hypothetical protein
MSTAAASVCSIQAVPKDTEPLSCRAQRRPPVSAIMKKKESTRGSSQCPSNYDLVVVDSVENLGFPIGSIKGALQSAIGSGGRSSSAGLIGCEMFSSSSTGKSWFRFAQFDRNRIKHRIKKDPCEAVIAVAVEVRAGFDHVGGI